MIFNNYPYTDFHEMNLDWVIKMIKDLDASMDEFKVVNAIEFGGEWDITKNYKIYTIVDTTEHNGYISIKAVPAGIPLSNENYWRQVANYGELYADVQNRIIALEYKIAHINDKRIIMISDSYANRVDASNNTFFDLIQQYLSLSNDDFYHNNLAGASFAHANESSRFLYLLQAIENTVTNKNTISDIIVVGGANDPNNTYAEIVNAIGAFVNYCNDKYPNAKVSLASPGLTFTSNGIASRQHSLKAWKDCTLYGAEYYTNSEYILCNPDLIEDDMCHPNASGVPEIAKNVVNCILTGACDVYYEMSNFSQVGGSVPSLPTLTVNNGGTGMNAISNNGNISVMPRSGSYSILDFTTTIYLELSPGGEIDIILNKSLFPGSYKSDSGYNSIIGQLIDTEHNKIYPVSIIPYTTDNSKNLKLRIFSAFAIPTSDHAYRFNLLFNASFSL